MVSDKLPFLSAETLKNTSRMMTRDQPGSSLPLSAGAVRMRRHRERRKLGKTLISLELSSNTIATLVALGWLADNEQNDVDKIVAAFRRFAGRALAVARLGGLDRWYVP
jgi:hypothetical protein